MSFLPPRDPLPTSIESSVRMNLVALRKVSDAQASGIRLAEELLSNGLQPVDCHERADRRSVTVWGILEVMLDSPTGLLQVRKLNEPEGHNYRKRHEVWLPHINALRVPEKDLLDAYCSWMVGRCLQIYGRTAEQAVKGMRNVLRAAFSQQEVIRLWRRLFNKWLVPQDLAKITRLAYGPDFTIPDFNRMAGERTVALRVFRETPRLLPVLGWILTTRATSIGNQVGQELFGQAVGTFEYFNRLRGALLSRTANLMKGGVCVESQDTNGDHAFSLEQLAGQEELLQLDFGGSETEIGGKFSPAAWARLCRLPVAGVRTVFQPRSPGIPKTLTALEYVAAAGEKHIPLPVLKKLCNEQPYRNITDCFDRRVRFLRLLIRESMRRLDESRPIRQLLQEEYPAIHDWLTLSGFAEGFPQANSTWASLLRRQETWHRNGGWNSGELPDVSWACPIEGDVIDGCEYRPLLSTVDLQREGEEMRHCVASRWEACLEGGCLIFSLCSTQGRSTLQLTRANEKWSISEHKGIENCCLPEGHPRVAKLIQWLLMEKTCNQEVTLDIGTSQH